MTRLPAATAPSTSPAPSMRPTSTCAAIATASSTSAMKMKMPNAIWCAASDVSPTLARTALAVRNAMSSDAERRKSSQEIRTSGLMSSGAGRRSTPGPPARRSRTANAPPIPTCAITVPIAEPSRPQSNP